MDPAYFHLKPTTSQGTMKRRAADRESSLLLAKLPDDCLRRCLQFSALHTELAALLVTCKRLRTLAAEDEPWELLCRHCFKLREPRAPEVDLSTRLVSMSWIECAKRWRAVAARVAPRDDLDGLLYSRVLDCWRTIEDFYNIALPSVTATLNPGAALRTFDKLVKRVEGKRPDPQFDWRPLWYIYSVHDGQRLRYDEAVHSRNRPEDMPLDDIFNGIFGGYSVYNEIVNCRLWPLKVVASLREQGCIPIAGNFNRRGRMIAVQYPEGGLIHRAAPHSSSGSLDVVVWLEEFARRLREGHYRIGACCSEFPNPCLLQFPQVPGELGCTRAVTKGIEVTASTVYLSWPDDPESGWTYSIRIRLLLPGEIGYETPAQRGFTTCQLRARHWAICEPEQETQHVNGPGVIGKFPLLKEGGYRDDHQSSGGRVVVGEEHEGTFVYQSCSGRVTNHGSFGGELIMVPGSLDRPQGPNFEVVVGRFPLDIPEFLF